MRKKHYGITLIALIGIGFWWTSTTEQNPKVSNKEKITKKADNRRSRVGPRSPPNNKVNPKKKSVRKIVLAPTLEQPDTEKTPTITPADNEKVQAYLKKLDELDEPDVADLTMLGELAFDANDSASAYDHYLEVIEEHTDDAMAPFALYKFAWVQYNLGDKQAAIDDMELVLEWIGEGETQLDDVLLSEVSTDLAFFKAN